MSYGFQSSEQSERYAKMKAAGYEYSVTEPDGAIVMERKERGYQYERTLEVVVIETDGTVNIR